MKLHYYDYEFDREYDYDVDVSAEDLAEFLSPSESVIPENFRSGFGRRALDSFLTCVALRIPDCATEAMEEDEEFRKFMEDKYKEEATAKMMEEIKDSVEPEIWADGGYFPARDPWPWEK